MDLETMTKLLMHIVRDESLENAVIIKKICFFLQEHLEWQMLLVDDLGRVLWGETQNSVERFTQIECSELFTVAPIIAQGEKLGHIVIEKSNLDPDEKVIFNISIMLLSVLMLYVKNKTLVRQSQNISVVKSALNILSYSELLAVLHVFKELQSTDTSIVIASKIAKENNITRSAIVNALRKLESARLIETRSLGMKGTYIKVLNGYLIDELEKLDGF